MTKLTAKQKMFVKEYLIDLNASAACRRAGYSEKTARYIGTELLAKPVIQAAVQEAKLTRQEALNLDAEWVLRRLKEISDRCMQATEVLVFNKETKEWDHTGIYEFDSSGANRSTELIGKHLAMFVDKSQHTGPNGGPIQVESTSRIAALTPEQRAQLLEQLRNKKGQADVPGQELALVTSHPGEPGGKQNA